MKHGALPALFNHHPSRSDNMAFWVSHWDKINKVTSPVKSSVLLTLEVHLDSSGQHVWHRGASKISCILLNFEAGSAQDTNPDRVFDLTPAWRHCLKFQSLRQDLVHLSSGFTHTPPVGLSITYTSPPASQRLWGQEWIVVFFSSRAEEPWWHAEWQASFLLVWTTGFEAKHAFLFWQMSCVARRWKITCASMVVLELCWPILLSASFQYPSEYNPLDSALVLPAMSRKILRSTCAWSHL